MRHLIDTPDRRSRARWRALAPLVALACGCVLADTLSHAFPADDAGRAAMRLSAAPSVAWFALASAAGVGAICLRGRGFRAAVLVWIVLLGGGWYSARVLEPRVEAAPLIAAAADRAIVTLEGVALTPPAPLPPPRDRITIPHRPGAGSAFDLSLTGARAGATGEHALRPVRARVRVLLSGKASEDLRAGARVRVTGVLAPVPTPMNPGERDRRLWANQAGEGGTLLAPPGLVVVIPPGERAGLRVRALSAWSAYRSGLRDRAARALAFERALHSDERALRPDADARTQGRALVAAITLGQRSPALREAEGAFRRVGLSHLMAISGFHVVVMTGVLLALLRLAGDRGPVEPLTAALLIGAYLTLVPAHAPVVRAGVMVIALLLAEALGRRHDRVAVLAWVALAVVLWRPLELFTLGFQLSFGLTGALLWIGPRWHARLFPARPLAAARPAHPDASDMLARPFRALVSTSLLCWALAVPLVIAHTGQFSPVAVVATVVATPIIVLALWVGYGALLVGIVAPSVGALAGALLEAIGIAAVRTAHAFDALPGASLHAPSPVPQLPGMIVALAGVVGIAICLASPRVRLTPRLGLALVAVWALALAHGAAFAHRPSPGVAMRLDTLAVGDGACHLIRAPRGAVLWDCGSLSGGLGWRTAPDALRAMGVRRVRAAVVTHPDLDHFAALADLAPRVGLRDLFVGEAFLRAAERDPRGATGDLLAHLRVLGVRVHVVAAGDVVTVGDLRLHFLHPPPGFRHERDNEHSLVASVRTDRLGALSGREHLLLTGDIERDAMDALRRAHPDLSARVVELPHHGSAHGAAHAFIANLEPEIVVQSTGPGRLDDPRWAHARERVGRWLATARDGATSVEWRTDGSLRAGAFRDRAR
ncbi:MAG: ComEC/Rec2 family competence protein [Phycisphaerales bacterium]|nr:MAG: ComEC/Rec2 family competence protein [Phycisphaerales bacterium]